MHPKKRFEWPPDYLAGVISESFLVLFLFFSIRRQAINSGKGVRARARVVKCKDTNTK